MDAILTLTLKKKGAVDGRSILSLYLYCEADFPIKINKRSKKGRYWKLKHVSRRETVKGKVVLWKLKNYAHSSW